MRPHDERWLAPPKAPTLGTDEVHLWRVRVDLAASTLRMMEDTLTSTERARGAAFRFPRDRARWMAARGILRAILSRYLKRDPETLRFTAGAYGKPALLCEAGQAGVLFNLSHSGALALYAISGSRAVGVDLERTRWIEEAEQLGQRCFSSAEVRQLQAVPAHAQHKAFLRCWTRKEAYVKARGLGLSLDLSLFDMSLHPGDQAALLATREEGQEAAGWSLFEVAAGEGYVAALAVQGHPTAIQCFRLDECYTSSK